MAVVKITDTDFDAKVLEAGKTVVVDVSTTWCPSCRMLEPVFEKASEELEDVMFAAVNASDNPEISARYNINYVPTLMLFKDGKLVKQSVGAKSPVELEEFILGE